MEGKKFLSPRGMVLCGALLLAAGALYLALSLLPQGTVAVVEQNGHIQQGGVAVSPAQQPPGRGA